MNLPINDKFKFYKNFWIYGYVSLHTAEFNIQYPIKQIQRIYAKLYSYMLSVNEKDCTKFVSFKSKFPNLSTNSENSIYQKKTGKYPFISLTNGVRIEISHSKEYGNVKIIVDPILFVRSRLRDFESENYNYLQISPKNLDFWRMFEIIFKKFLEKWEILLLYNDLPKPSRIDFCVNIQTSKNFNLKKYFKYLKRIQKNLRFKDKNNPIYANQDDMLDPDNKYSNMIKFGNSYHSITLYNKIAEQRGVFKRKYPGMYMLRIEYQVMHQKIESVLTDIVLGGYIGEDIKNSYDPNKYGIDLSYILYLLSLAAPYAILSAISDFFPSAHIRSKKKTYASISKLKCSLNIKKLIFEYVDMLSNEDSYDVVIEDIKHFKDTYGLYSYYTINRLLDENNICPVYLHDADKTSTYHSLPSVRDMYLSAVQNACNERKMD